MVNVTHQPCPYCESSDAFNYDKDKNVYNCFKCNKKGRYSDLENTNKVIDYVANNSSYVPKNLVDGKYLPLRGISQKTMEEFNVLTYGDQQEYIYPSGGKKVRTLSEKKFFAKDGFKGDELFGMNMFTAGCSKMVTVTEGELDALSVSQMLKSGYTNPVVSVPSGTISKKFWENCKDWLDSFEQIVLSFDNDDVGKALTEKFADVFPDKVFVVNHGNFKDANDFLTAGKQKEFVSAWWNKRKYSPAGFTSSPEDWMKIVDEENPYEYVPTPIVGLNDKIRGWVKGGLTILKAPPGVGKSSIFRMAQHDLVVNKKKVVAVLHMEEQKSTTARGLATYELGRNVNTKEDAENNGISEDEVKEALMRVVGEGNFISFEIDPHNAMESTLRQCNQAISVYDADFIFIDHFQRLAYLSGVDGATASLTELGVKLVELSKRKNVGIIGISHVNSDGHTKYAKSIEEEAIILIEFERDKLAEDADTRNTAYCTVTKNRPFALTGAAGALQYDNETTLVKEKGYT